MVGQSPITSNTPLSSEDNLSKEEEDDSDVVMPRSSSTIDLKPSHIYLILVSSLPNSEETTLKRLEARKSAILESIWTSQTSEQLQSIFRSSTSPFNASEISALAYISPSSSSGIPGLLHFIYLWKDSRQFIQSKLPLDLVTSHSSRKALYRAYAIAFDALTHPVLPFRHWNFSIEKESGQSSSKGLQSLLQEADAENSIGSIAGIHTTHAIVLAIFAPPESARSMKNSSKKGRLAKIFGPESSKIPEVMEKFAKFVKKDHDRWIITPGNV